MVVIIGMQIYVYMGQRKGHVVQHQDLGPPEGPWQQGGPPVEQATLPHYTFFFLHELNVSVYAAHLIHTAGFTSA